MPQARFHSSPGERPCSFSTRTRKDSRGIDFTGACPPQAAYLGLNFLRSTSLLMTSPHRRSHVPLSGTMATSHAHTHHTYSLCSSYQATISLTALFIIDVYINTRWYSFPRNIPEVRPGRALPWALDRKRDSLIELCILLTRLYSTVSENIHHLLPFQRKAASDTEYSKQVYYRVYIQMNKVYTNGIERTSQDSQGMGGGAHIARRGRPASLIFGGGRRGSGMQERWDRE